MKQAIQTGTVLALIIIGLLLAVFLMYKLAALTFLVLIAIVLTTGIDPVVTRLQQVRIGRRQAPRAVATTIVLLFGVTVVLGVIGILVGTATGEAIQFAREDWPRLRAEFIEWAQGLAARYEVLPEPGEVYRRLGEQSGNILGYLWSTTRAVFGVVGGLLSLVTIFFLTFFLTSGKDGITRVMARFVPPRHRQRVLEVSHLAGQKMGGWLRGMIILSLLLAVVVTLFMSLFGVRYPVLIGLLSGIGELIPVVGVYFALIPALLIMLLSGADLWRLLVVFGFFIVLSQLENYVFFPRVMQREVELPPVTAILAILVGGALLGLIGALLAIPFAAAGRVVLYEAIFPLIEGRGSAPEEESAAVPPAGAPARKRRKRPRVADEGSTPSG